MLLGADSIDECDVLRSGRTARVHGHRVMAPSTLGTFLRAFTFGHVRQLDRAAWTVIAAIAFRTVTIRRNLRSDAVLDTLPMR